MADANPIAPEAIQQATEEEEAAIRQATLERIVSPARRAARKRSTASRTTSEPSGDSTVGRESIASRAVRYARSSSNPWRTS